MFRNDVFAVSLVSAWFFIYVVLLQYDATRYFGLWMALFSPFLLCWMVFTILKHGKYSGPDLGTKEYGYADKPNP